MSRNVGTYLQTYAEKSPRRAKNWKPEITHFKLCHIDPPSLEGWGWLRVSTVLLSFYVNEVVTLQPHYADGMVSQSRPASRRCWTASWKSASV